MLNCCISRKKVRESETSLSQSSSDIKKSAATRDCNQKTKPSKAAKDKKEAKGKEWEWNWSHSDSSEDEEFFEAMDTSVKEDADIDNSMDTSESSQSNNVNNVSNSSSGSKNTSEVVPTGSKSEETAPKAASQSSKPAKDSKSETSIEKGRASINQAETKAVSGERVGNIPVDETDTETSFTDTWTHQPEGRVKVFADITLLNDPKQLMYVPVTQEPAPMTEDMLEEHAEVLAK